MSVTITINNCNECHFKSHSGAFTRGGAKNICGHELASGVERNGRIPLIYRRQDAVSIVVDPDSTQKDCYHWWHRTIGDGEIIPDWCPLREENK